jgi:hypothetical protein
MYVNVQTLFPMAVFEIPPEDAWQLLIEELTMLSNEIAQNPMLDQDTQQAAIADLQRQIHELRQLIARLCPE